MTVSDLLNLPGWQVIAVEEQQDRYMIDRQGRGYSFDVLRARLLYGQSLRQRRKRGDSQVVDEHVEETKPSTRQQQVELLPSTVKNTTESD